MKISVISVFPDLYKPFLDTSLVKKAQENKLVDIQMTDFFSGVEPKERIDAPTFGHGAGMLIKPDVVQRVIEKLKNLEVLVLKYFFSPQGKSLLKKFLILFFKNQNNVSTYVDPCSL